MSGKGRAISKLKGIKSNNLQGLLDYIEDKKKTSLEKAEEVEETIIDIELNYISNPEKTADKLLVSGHNCNPSTAKLEFEMTKDSYYEVKKENLKEGERPNVAFHLIQSFEGKNYDPNLIHEIGQEFAKELLTDNFQAVIATHINTDNYHNHIVFNAYSCKGAFKYLDNTINYTRMRDINDKICKKYGLEIILNPDKKKGHSYKEWLEIKEGTSWKEQIRKDIVNTMDISKTWEEYKSYLEAAGYTITENSRSVTYKAPGSNLKVRDVKLGKEYTKNNLEDFWELKQNDIEKKLKIKLKNYKKKETLYVSSRDATGRKRSLLEIVFLKAIKILKKIGKMFEFTEGKKLYPDNPIFLSADEKVQHLYNLLKTVQDNKFDTKEDIQNSLNNIGIELSQTKSEISYHKETLDNLEEINDAIKTIEELKDKIVDLGINYNNLQIKEFTEEETLFNKAAINPMSKKQRMLLFQALKDQEDYRLDFKYDEIDKETCNRIVEFFNKKKDEEIIDIPRGIITTEEFNFKKLKKKYIVQRDNRYKNMKNKFNEPLDDKQKEELKTYLKGTGIKLNIDKLTVYESILIKENINKENPLMNFKTKKGAAITKEQKKEILELFTIHPGELPKDFNIDKLDKKTAKELTIYLLLKDYTPELLKEKEKDKDLEYNKMVSKHTPEEQELIHQYRYAIEKIRSIGIDNIEEFKEQIQIKKEKLEVVLEKKEELSKTYKEINDIRKGLEYINNKKFVYGPLFNSGEIDVEIREEREQKRKEEREQNQEHEL